MKVIKSEYNVFVDVDLTLILPLEPGELRSGRRVEVYDAVTKRMIVMQAHDPNVRLLTEEKHRGATIIVWSRGGYEWASNVVKALDLENKVDYVMSKPMMYMDDIPIDEWLKYRVYLEPNMRYKK